MIKAAPLSLILLLLIPPPPRLGYIHVEAFAMRTVEIAVIRQIFVPSAATVVMEYVSEPCKPEATSLLRYWVTKQSVWLYLCVTAQHLLSCPPSSIPGKRIFFSCRGHYHPTSLTSVPCNSRAVGLSQVNLLLFTFLGLHLEGE